MRKGFWKQLSYEDKFDRKYACWAVNHNGWRKCKRLNRRAASWTAAGFAEADKD